MKGEGEYNTIMTRNKKIIYKNNTNNSRLSYNKTKTKTELIRMWAQIESLMKGQRKLNSKNQDRMKYYMKLPLSNNALY